MELDDVLSLALKGEQSKGLAFKDPQRLYNSSNGKYLKDISADHSKGEETVDYLYKTMSETISSADYIISKADRIPPKKYIPILNWGKT